MDVQSWERLIRQWSADMIEDDDFVSEGVPDSVIATQWLGYPGATEAQIAAAEQRLGVGLPPSYRTFLQLANGWRQIHYIYRMWSTEAIEWFAVRNQAWINMYLKYYGGQGEHACEQGVTTRAQVVCSTQHQPHLVCRCSWTIVWCEGF